jgi:hypothetical protein
MHRWLLGALALLLITAPAAAQTEPALDLVPDSALGFILVKDLGQLSRKVERLAEKLGAPEKVSLLEQIQQQMGIREGLNSKGSAVFIVLKGKKEHAPEVVVALPVTDSQKVLRQLGVKPGKDGIGEGAFGGTSETIAGVGGKAKDKGKEGPARKVPVLAARKDAFVLLTPPDSRDGLERVLTSRKGIAALVQPARAWMDEQDVSGVCTDKGVQVGLAMLLTSPAGSAQSSTPGQYADMKAVYADVEKNVRLIAFGARFEQDGHSRLLARVCFDPNGGYAQWLAKAKALRRDILTHFPDRSYILAAEARLSPQADFEGAFRFCTGGLPPQKAEELVKAWGRLLRRVSEVGLTVYPDARAKQPPAGGAGKQPEAEEPVAALLAKVDDAPAFVAGAADLLKQSYEAARAAKEPTPDLTFREGRIAGKPSRLILFTEGEGDSKAGGSDQGPKTSPHQDGRHLLFFAQMDAQTVLAGLVRGDDQAEALVRTLAERPGRPLGTNPHLRKTAALLPEHLQVAAYLDLRAYGRSAGVPPAADLPACPPLGFALQALPAGIEAQFVIPFGTLDAVFRASKEAGKQKKPGE